CSLLVGRVFSLAGPRRDLHSFPTRRSSDLTRRYSSVASNHGWSRRSSTAAERTLYQSGSSTHGGTVPLSRSACTAASRRCATARSEEHTSELQSLAYLVCRLLLEKKNKNES